MNPDWIADDCGLYYPLPWVSWQPGEDQDTVCLDGDFTVQELRDIADHMEKHKSTAPYQEGEDE